MERVQDPRALVTSEQCIRLGAIFVAVIPTFVYIASHCRAWRLCRRAFVGICRAVRTPRASKALSGLKRCRIIDLYKHTLYECSTPVDI